MRALVQRVAEASVEVEGAVVAQIGHGLLVLLGISSADTLTSSLEMSQKIAQLRIFADENGKMNRNVGEVGGGVLIVSQFTLYGDTSRGNRPSFSAAAKPDAAAPIYHHFIHSVRDLGLPVSEGKFQAHMRVTLINDGPVTLLLEN